MEVVASHDLICVQISLPRKGTETDNPSKTAGINFCVQISLPRKGTETELKNEERKTKIENSLLALNMSAKPFRSSFFLGHSKQAELPAQNAY